MPQFMKTAYKRIRRFFLRWFGRIEFFYYDVKNGAKSLWTFRKAVAAQRPWDACHTYDLLLVKLISLEKSDRLHEIEMKTIMIPKLIKMREEFEKENGIEGSDYVETSGDREAFARQRKSKVALRVCIKILKRITEEWYSEVVEKRNPKIEWGFGCDKSGQCEFDWCGLGHSKKEHYMDDVVRFEFDVVQPRDKKLLWVLLSEYLDGWWS